MTFEEWWDSSKSSATPDTYKGWEESCRQAWEAGARAEREACAKLCETVPVKTARQDTRDACAAAIRTRSND